MLILSGDRPQDLRRQQAEGSSATDTKKKQGQGTNYPDGVLNRNRDRVQTTDTKKKQGQDATDNIYLYSLRHPHRRMHQL